MHRFFSFTQFLLEKEVPLSSPIEDYTVKDMSNGKFEMNWGGAPYIFSVNPVPKDLDTYRKVFYTLINSIQSSIPSKMYEAVEEAQALPFKFGNIFSSSLSLSNVKDLEINLTDSQKNTLKTSETEFLENDFASLPKETKNDIIEYLKDLAERAAVVLECLFYYTRTGDEKNFYQSQNFDSLVDSYTDIVDNAQEKKKFILDGPFDSYNSNEPVQFQVDYIYWKMENKKTSKRYVLRATTSPELLNTEDKIGKKLGLTLGILDEKGNEISDDLTRFPAEELEDRIDSLETIKENTIKHKS